MRVCMSTCPNIYKTGYLEEKIIIELKINMKEDIYLGLLN